VNDVVAGASIEAIIIIAAIDDVITLAAKDAVKTIAAIDAVIAAFAIDGVISIITADKIVSSSSIYCILPPRPTITSRLGVPTRLSLFGVPTMVAEAPKQVIVCAITAGKVVVVLSKSAAVTTAIPHTKLLLVKINLIFLSVLLLPKPKKRVRVFISQAIPFPLLLSCRTCGLSSTVVSSGFAALIANYRRKSRK
jgi:hypothetical protein